MGHDSERVLRLSIEVYEELKYSDLGEHDADLARKLTGTDRRVVWAAAATGASKISVNERKDNRSIAFVARPEIVRIKTTYYVPTRVNAYAGHRKINNFWEVIKRLNENCNTRDQRSPPFVKRTF